MNKILDRMFVYQDKLSLVGGIIGVNVGVYQFVKNESNKNTPSTFFAGALVGGVVGYGFGYASPILAPFSFLGIPGYLVARHRSSLRELLRKEEKQEVQMKQLAGNT